MAQRPVPDRIVLASASPRRVELLRQIGIACEIHPAAIDENSIRHDDPVRLAVLLATTKAKEVARRIDSPLPLLAADTVVAVAGTILEKPLDRADARRMIGILSGRTHQVITGITLLPVGRSPGGRDSMITGYAESHVRFATLSDDEVEGYLDSGEWRDVAGAYRIQGIAARYVTHLEGSYSNVVGLPLHLVYSILSG